MVGLPPTGRYLLASLGSPQMQAVHAHPLRTFSPLALSFELLTGHVTWVVPLAWDVGISSVSEFPGWCCAFLVAVSLTMGVAFSLGGRAGLLVGPFAGGVYSCWILEGAG